MMRTWLFLARAGGLLQAMLAARVRKQTVGFLIPAAFAGFAGYACTSLSRVGIDFPVLFCFWLPSVVQLLVFELVFWQKRYESQQPERNAKEGKRNEA